MMGLPCTESIQESYTILDLLNGEYNKSGWLGEDKSKYYIDDIFSLMTYNLSLYYYRPDTITGLFMGDSNIKKEGFGDTVKVVMASGNSFISGLDTLFAVEEKDEYRIFPEIEQFNKCKAKDLEGKKLLCIYNHRTCYFYLPNDMFTDVILVKLDEVVKVEPYEPTDLYSFVGPTSHWAGLHSGEYFYFVHDSFVDAKTVINKGWVDTYQINKAYEEYKSEWKCTSSRNNLEFLYGVLKGE